MTGLEYFTVCVVVTPSLAFALQAMQPGVVIRRKLFYLQNFRQGEALPICFK